MSTFKVYAKIYLLSSECTCWGDKLLLGFYFQGIMYLIIKGV